MVNGSDISDLAWGGMVSALLPSPLSREHPWEQGKLWEGDARLSRTTPQTGGFSIRVSDLPCVPTLAGSQHQSQGMVK